MYELTSGQRLDKLEFPAVRGLEGVKEATVVIPVNPKGPLKNKEVGARLGGVVRGMGGSAGSAGGRRGRGAWVGPVPGRLPSASCHHAGVQRAPSSPAPPGTSHTTSPAFLAHTSSAPLLGPPPPP